MKPTLCVLLAVAAAAGGCAAGNASRKETPMDTANVTALRLDQSRPGRYARSFVMPDGSINVLGIFRVSDAGRKVKLVLDSSGGVGPLEAVESKMNSFFSRKGLFLALYAGVKPAGDHKYVGTIWRSTDGLKTLTEERTTLILPEAGDVDFGKEGQWAGLIFHRGIVELKDGSLMAAMYGNFAEDKVKPTHGWSKMETVYKMRAFAVRSEDEGRTWRYLASVAVPSQDRPDDTEGFNEWTMTRLRDGRLLGIVRTGHFTPMVAVRSSDEGRTWTEPKVPEGLADAGCDPFLVTLADGRVALACGEMVQVPHDSPEYEQGFKTRKDQRRRCLLAVADDKTGEKWRTTEVAGYDNRSAYATIFDVAPNAVVYQSDLDLWRVEIPAAE
jgi:hypothetical protein